jgi:hypothetical protein
MVVMRKDYILKIKDTEFLVETNSEVVCKSTDDSKSIFGILWKISLVAVGFGG